MAEMLDFRLLRSVGRPHRNLSPWIGGGLLAIGGLSALVAVALTPVRAVPAEGHMPMPEPASAPTPAPSPLPLPLHVVAIPAPGALPSAVPQSPPYDEPPAGCKIPDKDVYDLSKWSVGDDHFGPLITCAPVTSEMLAWRLPGYRVLTEIVGEGESVTYVVATRRERMLRIWPPYPGEAQPIMVTILSRTIPTPDGVRVGDRVRDLQARYADLTCEYGALEGDEDLWCRREADPGTWVFNVRLADLSSDDHARVANADGDIELRWIANARIESITWNSDEPERRAIG